MNYLYYSTNSKKKATQFLFKEFNQGFNKKYSYKVNLINASTYRKIIIQMINWVCKIIIKIYLCESLGYTKTYLFFKEKFQIKI